MKTLLLSPGPLLHPIEEREKFGSLIIAALLQTAALIQLS
jgi:hypothetical protein